MIIQPADLLLWRVDPQASWVDRMIGWGERKIGEQKGEAGYYHVAFARDVNWMYSSQPPKIDLYLIPFPLPDHMEVYRLISTPNANQLADLFSYAESRRGRWYDFLGVCTFGMVKVGGLEFCSQYTEDSYAHAGILISPDVQFTTPDDIASSPSIHRVQ